MILITGGKGYIGSNLEQYLKSMKDAYCIYDIVDGYDILDFYVLSEQIRRSTCCIHLAGISGISECEKDPLLTMKTNILGTYYVFKLCRIYGIKALFSSSFAVYENNFNPDNLYGLSKLIAEKIVLDNNGIVMRFSNVFGGLNFLEKKNTAIARLMKGNFEDRGHGDEKRDFIHVEDVVKKIYQLIQVSFPGSINNVCSDNEITINELVELSRNPDFPNNIREMYRN